jgi:hypothetical protein
VGGCADGVGAGRETGGEDVKVGGSGVGVVVDESMEAIRGGVGVGGRGGGEVGSELTGLESIRGG